MKKKSTKYSNVIEDFWTLMDREINLLLEKFKSKEIYIILMSDHGFTSFKGFFYLGQWFLDNMYSVPSYKLTLLKHFNKIGVNLDSIVYILTKLKLVLMFKKIIPKKYQQKLISIFPEKGGRIGKHFFKGMEELVDLENSKIIPIDGIYINKNIVTNEEYNIFRDEIINKMMKIKNPKTGKRLHKHIYKKEEIYSGKYLDNAPDIIPVSNEGYNSICSFTTKKLWCFSDPVISGVHKFHGIFCLTGPGIKKNQEIKKVKIIDLAPTILHLFDVPIPNDIDGRVLTECFEEDSKLAKREIAFQDVKKIEKLKDKIKGLKKEGKI